MVLQYGDVDPCVSLDQGLMDLSAFQVHATRDGYFLEIFLIVGRHDDTSGLFYGLGDPARLVAFLPVIAGALPELDVLVSTENRDPYTYL